MGVAGMAEAMEAKRHGKMGSGRKARGLDGGHRKGATGFGRDGTREKSEQRKKLRVCISIADT